MPRGWMSGSGWLSARGWLGAAKQNGGRRDQEFLFASGRVIRLASTAVASCVCRGEGGEKKTQHSADVRTPAHTPHPPPPHAPSPSATHRYRVGRGELGRAAPGNLAPSRRRDCHFADTPCLPLLKHLIKVQGGRCHQMTVAPTASRRDCHHADALSPSLLNRLLKAEEGAAE